MKFDFKYIAAFLTTVLLFLAVVVISGDYIEYRRNYKDFQQYLAEKNEPEKETETPITPSSSDDYMVELSTEESTEQTGSTESVTRPETEVVDNGGVLEGSNQILDVSGNVLWQATGISAEDYQQICDYVEERRNVYTWANSYDKTVRIAELDRMIIETAGVTFPNISINFIGDSITEGVGGKETGYGGYVSYVDYFQQHLQFKAAYNNGKAGRMIGDFNRHPELSIAVNESSLMNNTAQITVLYAGLNDFLTTEETKNFGILDNGTIGGYRGQLQMLFHSIENNYPGMDVFIITAYQTPLVDGTTNFTNFDGIPVLNDYMEPQRILAKECGYHVIDLYNCGFMDVRDAQTAEVFLADSIHPNDEGNKILGDHVAAEILLYYLGIE